MFLKKELEIRFKELAVPGHVNGTVVFSDLDISQLYQGQSPIFMNKILLSYLLPVTVETESWKQCGISRSWEWEQLAFLVSEVS